MTPRAALLLPLLGACGAGTDHPAAAPRAAGWPFRASPRIGHDPGAFSVQLPAPERDEASPPPPPGVLPEPSVVGGLLPDLVGGTFDPSLGLDLEDALAQLPPERQEMGLAGVDIYDLIGPDGKSGLCQDPRILLDLDLDGAAYEAALDVPWGHWMTEAPRRDLYALPDACVGALLAAAGDTEAAVTDGDCTQADERAHFRSGSACRTCLDVDGDHGRCLAEGLCPETATRAIYGEGRWLSMLRVETLMCAPDYMAEAILLMDDLEEDDPLPGVYDHRIEGLCFDAWSEDRDEATLACSTLTGTTAIGDGLMSRVAYIRPAGADAAAWAGRISLVHSVEVEGRTFGLAFLGSGGASAISAPGGSSADAWGLNPLDMQPYGTDPDDPDHTLAREYISAVSLKTVTTREGVLVNPINHNRCPEDGWAGPHADGTYSCAQPGDWYATQQADDGMLVLWDDSAHEFYAFPLLTLISTGLPDPSVPGGLLTHVLGSTTLADAEWESCAWPETFVPDRLRMYDPIPTTSPTPYASFDGQTYRFGKDPDLDIRLALATNQTRGFCVEGL